MNGLDSHTADAFTRYALRQHVSSPTHRDGNVLDLMLTRDNDTPRAQLISDVAVQSVCFSDHHLVTCRLGVPPPPSAVTTSFTYRALRRIDKQAFCQDILQSRLYGSPQSDADEYADLFDAEVTRVLDIHAPLRTGRCRCSGQHDTYFLSDEARQVKRRRRRLERRYRRSGLQSDKQAHNAACEASRDSIMTSRADHIRTQLEQATLCFTALHPAPFRSFSECRTTPRESYCRRRGVLTPTRCYRSCTGYQWSSASPTNWPS